MVSIPRLTPGALSDLRHAESAAGDTRIQIKSESFELTKAIKAALNLCRKRISDYATIQ